jgi:hypothetical protein
MNEFRLIKGFFDQNSIFEHYVQGKHYVIRYRYIYSYIANDSESATMIRLNELHVKAGSARQQQYDEKQRRIVNQHNTGIVCRYTLMNILKEKSEDLWICPMCNEDDLATKLN